MGRIKDEDQAYVAELIRVIARRLAGHWSLGSEMIEDLDQDLWTDLLARWPRFDPSRSSSRTFADRVVRHHACRILEKQLAQCRNPACLAGSVERFEEVDEDSPSIRNLDDYLRATSSNGLDATALRIDLQRALQGMSPEIRELCHLRSQGLTVRELAKKAGISTSTAHRVFASAREQLQELGLDEYL